jgi:hypothetical protein
MDTSLAVDSDLVSVPVSWSQSCLESSPNSSAKKVRLSGSLSPLGCIEKHSRDVSVSDCMLVDSDYMFMESKPRDVFDLNIVVQRSQSLDIKPLLNSNVRVVDVVNDPVHNAFVSSDAVSEFTDRVSVPDVDITCRPDIAEFVSSLAADHVLHPESFLVGSVDCPVVEDTMKDYSVVPNDFADLDFPDICFPDSLDNCNLSNALNDSELFDDNFVLTVDDVDECLFVDESLTVPVHVFNDSGPSRFGTVTEAELENVRRSGIRHSESSECWAVRVFDDWRSFRSISIHKAIADLSKEKDLKPFVEMLTRFILEVKKKDGQLYHPTKY